MITEQNECAKSDVQIFLGYSERSTGQLRNKVLSLGYPGHVADTVVMWAVEYGLVNNSRFCSVFISSRVLGISRLKLELKKRGVPEADVDEALASVSESRTVPELVKLVSKKYGHIENSETARRRAVGWLSRRGFSSETIRSVLSGAL
jgi:SOS response regulatory protein OraA/RecX